MASDLRECRDVQGFPVILYVHARGSFGKPCTTLHTGSDPFWKKEALNA